MSTVIIILTLVTYWFHNTTLFSDPICTLVKSLSITWCSICWSSAFGADLFTAYNSEQFVIGSVVLTTIKWILTLWFYWWRMSLHIYPVSTHVAEVSIAGFPNSSHGFALISNYALPANYVICHTIMLVRVVFATFIAILASHGIGWMVCWWGELDPISTFRHQEIRRFPLSRLIQLW